MWLFLIRSHDYQTLKSELQCLCDDRDQSNQSSLIAWSSAQRIQSQPPRRVITTLHNQTRGFFSPSAFTSWCHGCYVSSFCQISSCMHVFCMIRINTFNPMWSLWFTFLWLSMCHVDLFLSVTHKMLLVSNWLEMNFEDCLCGRSWELLGFALVLDICSTEKKQMKNC